jgi:hypothetical protein
LSQKATEKSIAIGIKPIDRMKDVKAKVRACLVVEPDKQRLIYRGKRLGDGNTLQDYSLLRSEN